MASSITAVLAVGQAAVGLVVRRTHLYWFERWALAYVVGLWVTFLCWFTLSPLFSLTGPVAMAPIICAAIVIAIRRQPPECFDYRPLDRRDFALAIILGLELGLLTAAAMRSSLGFDGVFNFEMKARLMFEHGSGQLPLSYLSDSSRNWSHPQYPLLVPFAELWIYTWLGATDQAAIKILFPLFFLALAAFVGGAVRRVAGRRNALLTGVVLGLLPPLTLIPGAASGYADVPLAAAVAGAGSFAVLALRTGNGEAAILAGLLSGIAAWIKVEGLYLGGIVAVLAFAFSRARASAPGTRGRDLMSFVGIPLLAAAPWLFVQHRYGIAPQDLLELSAGTFYQGLLRLPEVAGLMARELARPGHWGLIWPAWVVAAAVALLTRRERSDLFLAAAVSAGLGLYLLPFVFTTWADVGEHVRSALPRLLVPLAPLALLLIMTVFCREYDRGDSGHRSLPVTS